MLFHIVDDCFVIIRCRGVYRQAKVFCRRGKLYAGYGAGFVRLMGGGGTTVPAMMWEELSEHPHIALKATGPVLVEPDEPEARRAAA